MSDENNYVREQFWRMWKSMQTAVPITNPNLKFAKIGSGVTGAATQWADSGRPDHFVCLGGQFLATEYKFDLNGVYMGNPNNPDDTRGWHANQRRWYKECVVDKPHAKMEYWLGVGIVVAKNRKATYYARESVYYLVPAVHWLWTEQEAQFHLESRTVPLTHSKFSITEAWEPYRIRQDGDTWGNLVLSIPRKHPLFSLSGVRA